jgi:hypothetical protein
MESPVGQIRTKVAMIKSLIGLIGWKTEGIHLFIGLSVGETLAFMAYAITNVGQGCLMNPQAETPTRRG